MPHPEPTDPPALAALLDRTREIAANVLAPRAQEVDQAELLPAGHLRVLAEAGLLGLAVPAEYGGHGAPGRVVREYMAILAAACGVTTFVQMQHVLACGFIAGSDNEALKRRALPVLAAGERFCSVAYSHVRRPGPPMVRAEPVPGGYRLNGSAPWMTGCGLADDCVFGGTLPDGRYLFALAALPGDGRVVASPPMRLCAVSASATVSLACRDFDIPAEDVIRIMTPEQMAARDVGGSYTLTSLSLGVARGATGLVARLGEQHASAVLAGTAAELLRRVEALVEEIDCWAERGDHPEYATRGILLRAAAIELGVRAAHAAVTATGGSANSLDHPAQRFFREAMLYTLTAQTRPVQTAALALLTGPADD